MIKGIYGINIAVSNYEDALNRFEKVLNVKPVHFNDNDFAFPNLVGARFFLGDVTLSPISSKTDDTSIAKFLDKKGDGVFLISLLVDDIEKDVEDMKSKGIKFVMDIKEVPLGKVTFTHPKSFFGIQFEILQLRDWNIDNSRY